MENARKVIGIDISGVIAVRPEIVGIRFASKKCLQIPVVGGAFAAIKKLVQTFGPDSIFIVSKMSTEASEAGARKWLSHHRFFGQTGVLLNHLHFCRQRREKASVCRRLGINHFIDDRLEVLSSMEFFQLLLLFQPDLQEVNRFNQYLLMVKIVEDWPAVLEKLL